MSIATEVAVKELQSKVRALEDMVELLARDIESLKHTPATDVPRGTVSNTKQSVARR